MKRLRFFCLRGERAGPPGTRPLLFYPPATWASSRAALLCSRWLPGSRARAFLASASAYSGRPVRWKAMARRSWGRLPQAAASQI